jgi:hypothetical protein
MGQHVHCIATWNGRRSVGTASLESEELLFRGEFRLRISFKSVADLGVQQGMLTLKTPEGTASFNLGARADLWAERIRNPRGVLEKLGIKPEWLVSVVGVSDRWFLDELAGRVEHLQVGKLARNSDVIFAGVNTARDLRQFEALQASLKSDGAIWAIRPKGVAEVSEAIVMNAARDAGLVDVKVVRPKLAR